MTKKKMSKLDLLNKTKDLMELQDMKYDRTDIKDKNLINIHSYRLDEISDDITMSDLNIDFNKRILKDNFIRLLNTDENNVKRSLLVESTLVNEENSKVDARGFDKNFNNDSTVNEYSKQEILCRSTGVDTPNHKDFIYIKDIFINGIMLDPMTSYRKFTSELDHNTGTDRFFLSPDIYTNRLGYFQDKYKHKHLKDGYTIPLKNGDDISIITRKFPKINDSNFYQIISLRQGEDDDYQRLYPLHEKVNITKGSNLKAYDGLAIGDYKDYGKNLAVYRYNYITGQFDIVSDDEYCFANDKGVNYIQFYKETRLDYKDIYLVVNKLKFFNIEIDTFYDSRYRVTTKDYLDGNSYITSIPLLFKGTKSREQVMFEDKAKKDLDKVNILIKQIEDQIKNLEITRIENPNHQLFDKLDKLELRKDKLETDIRTAYKKFYKDNYFYNIHKDVRYSEYMKEYFGIEVEIPIPVMRPEELSIWINGLKLIPRVDYNIRKNKAGYREIKFSGVVENGSHVLVRSAYGDMNTNYHAFHKNFQTEYFYKVRDSNIPLGNRYTEMYAGRRRIKRTDKNVLVDNILLVEDQKTTKNLEILTTIPPSNMTYHTVRYYKDHATTLSEISDSFYRDIIQLYKRENKIRLNQQMPGNVHWNKSEVFIAIVDDIELFSNMNIVPEGETPELTVYGTIDRSNNLSDNMSYSLDVTEDCTITDVTEDWLKKINEQSKNKPSDKDKYTELTGKAIIELRKGVEEDIAGRLHPDKEYRVIEAVYNIIVDEERGAPTDVIYLEVVPKAISTIDLVTNTNLYKVGDSVRNTMMVKVTYDDGTIRYYKDDRDTDIQEDIPNEYGKCTIDAPEIATLSHVGIQECKAIFNYSYDKANDAPKYVTAYKNILITEDTEREIESIKVIIKVDDQGKQRLEVIIKYTNNLVQHIDSNRINVKDITGLNLEQIKQGEGIELDSNNLNLEDNKSYDFILDIYANEDKKDPIKINDGKNIVRNITITETSPDNLNTITVNGQLLSFDQRQLDDLNKEIKFYRVKTLNNNYLTLGVNPIDKEAIFFGDLIDYEKSTKNDIHYKYVIVEFYNSDEEGKEGDIIKQSLFLPKHVSAIDNIEATLTGDILNGYVLTIPNNTMRLTEDELFKVVQDLYITSDITPDIRARFTTPNDVNKYRLTESENAENDMIVLYFNDKATSSMSAYGIKCLIDKELGLTKREEGLLTSLKVYIPYTKTNIQVKHNIKKNSYYKIGYIDIYRKLIGSVEYAILKPDLTPDYEVMEVYEVSTKNYDSEPRKTGNFTLNEDSIELKLGALTADSQGVISAENQSGLNLYIYKLKKGNEIRYEYIEIERISDRFKPMVYSLKINGSKNILDLNGELNKK